MAEPATAAYFSRIDNAKVSRHFSARLEVFFNGNDAPPIELGSNMIRDYSYRREMAAEDTFPLGRVSANSLTINLNNTQQLFTFTNTTSPFYGKLKQGVKTILYSSLQMEDGSFEEFQMGVLYTSDWDVVSNAIIANVVCYDRLFFLRQQRAPKLPVLSNITIAQLFIELFLALGLTTSDFVIDSALNYNIPYGWLPGDTVDEVLCSLTQAGMCTVYVNRYDKIIVTVPYIRKPVGRILSANSTANAQIKTVTQTQASYKTYTGVDIKYNIYTPIEDSTLAILSNQHIDAFVNEFTDISFSITPVLAVTRVYMQNTEADIIAMSIGARNMDIFLNASKEAERADIHIFGKTLSSTQRTISFNSTIEADTSQKKRLEVSSELMQSKNAVKEYGKVLNQIITDPNAYLSASLRGDLTFDLGDVYVLDDIKHKINMLPVYFTRIILNYNGALSCEVDCTNYNTLTIYDYAFLMPGFYVKVIRNQ